MLSKNQVKLIQKLQQKKYRNELNLFIVEGKKSIVEFLQAGYRLELLIATEVFGTALNNHPITLVSKEELRKVSSLKNPGEGLAIFHQRQHKGILQEGVILALDNVQDPGNLGTLICNTQTVDCYNPKVVQATMGSLTRVAVHYVDLAGFLATCALPLYAMDLDGENLYTTEFPEDCVLILGNEANGISPEVRALADGIITIPRFGKLQQTESLNVAMAGAIVVSQVRKLEN